MTFQLIKTVKAILEPDEYSFLFSNITQLTSETFSEFTSGVITKKDDKFQLMCAYPVREWIHFPIQIQDDLSFLHSDFFFKEVETALPEFKKDKFLFFPMDMNLKNNSSTNSWFFISAGIMADDAQREGAFLLVDIIREAITKIKKIDKIKELTIVDEVTGLYNTRHLFSILEQAVVQSGRYYAEFSLIFIDIDHFKMVNDTHGHLIGTKLLKELGKVIIQYLRKADLAFRYGGDEFVIYLPYTSKANSKYVLDRLWENVRKHEFDIDGIKLKITASYGSAGYPDDGKTVKEIIEKADIAMYNVKKRSRDGIEIAK